jgi:hypothetical protein
VNEELNDTVEIKGKEARSGTGKSRRQRSEVRSQRTNA